MARTVCCPMGSLDKRRLYARTRFTPCRAVTDCAHHIPRIHAHRCCTAPGFTIFCSLRLSINNWAIRALRHGLALCGFCLPLPCAPPRSYAVPSPTHRMDALPCGCTTTCYLSAGARCRARPRSLLRIFPHGTLLALLQHRGFAFTCLSGTALPSLPIPPPRPLYWFTRSYAPPTAAHRITAPRTAPVALAAGARAAPAAYYARLRLPPLLLPHAHRAALCLVYRCRALHYHTPPADTIPPHTLHTTHGPGTTDHTTPAPAHHLPLLHPTQWVTVCTRLQAPATTPPSHTCTHTAHGA